MTYKILKNNIIDENYNRKIIKWNWIDKERTDAILFDKNSGSSLWHYIQQLTEADWLEYSTKIITEKIYGLYGTDDLDIVKQQYEFDYDASRLNRIINLQTTLWYFLLQHLINSPKNLEPIGLYNTNNFGLDGINIKNIIVSELLMFRHYYKDNIIVHSSSTKMVDNKNWILLFFIHVNDKEIDKVLFIDSQETVYIANNQIVMFPAYLANDFMIIKKQQEEEPLYYIQAILSLE